MEVVKRRAKRIGTAIVGGALLIVGIIAIPYPGPGWLIVFTALAILATEFTWAQRVLDKARGKYDRWESWLKRQNTIVKVFFWLLTAAVVVLTLWLLNAYGMLEQLFHLNLPWLHSPLGIFH